MLDNTSHKARYDLVDVLRGVALLAMTLFHLGWDLELLGLAQKGFAAQPAMKWFAVCIASSFLFLVGVSLVLAHGNHFNKKSFALRLAKVSAAALLVTIATYFATPNFYIFFGILHHIAIASILGLVFVKAPMGFNFLCAILIVGAGIWLKLDLFSHPYLAWLGLGNYTPRSSDFVPLFPFFAAALFGIGVTQYLDLAQNKAQHFAFRYSANTGFTKALRFIGKNSLVYYLVHQPIMLGILWLGVYLWHFVLST
ncbi:MAG: heparan-alpha-glucosaminide N-acetyltransferase [Nitratireductor sp.]